MKIKDVKASFGMVNLRLIFATLGHLVGTLRASHTMATHIKKDEDLQTFIHTT
jgi:hypothetical protein